MVKINPLQDSSITLDEHSIQSIQHLIDALPYYVLLVDNNHNIIMSNDVLDKVLGLNKQDLIGSYCPKVIHGCDSPIPECPLEESVEKGRAIEREIFDEKSKRWVLSAIYPTSIVTPAGQTVYFHTTRDITEKINSQQKLEESLAKLQQITNSVIKTLTVTVEKRDPYTAGHQARVSSLASAIAEKLGLSEVDIEGIRVASLVHDIGKIAVPIEILSKPGKISGYEYSIIKDHPLIGYDIIKEIDFPWPVAQMVLQHHEKINGTGYPKGLSGNEISIGARILCVADVVEAMISHRPYRQALGIDKALEELQLNKGILYDSEVVSCCEAVFLQGFSF